MYIGEELLQQCLVSIPAQTHLTSDEQSTMTKILKGEVTKEKEEVARGRVAKRILYFFGCLFLMTFILVVSIVVTESNEHDWKTYHAPLN